MNNKPHIDVKYKDYPVDKKTLMQLQEKAEVLHQGNSAYTVAMVFELIIMIALAMIIALSINRFLLRVVRVDGSSMDPTFLHGERVLTERLSYNFKLPERGDVVICTYKRGPNKKGTKKINQAVTKGKEIFYDGPNVHIGDDALDDSNFIFERVIKRVVAIPGETIEIIDGLVYINGEQLNENAYWNDYIHGDIEAVTIPEDEFFVVGDNRNHSGDSRFREIGSIPLHRMQGRVIYKIWPLSSIGTFMGKR